MFKCKRISVDKTLHCRKHEIVSKEQAWNEFVLTIASVSSFQSTCDPVVNHSESISHTVSVPLQTTLGTLEEIACWVHLLSTPPGRARYSASRSLKTDLGPIGAKRRENKGLSLFFFQTFKTCDIIWHKQDNPKPRSFFSNTRTSAFLTNTICLIWTHEGYQKLVDLSGQPLVNKNTSMWGTANAHGLSVLSCSDWPFWSLLPKPCKLLTTENVVKLF